MKKRLLILLSVILTGIYSFGAVPLQGIKNIPGDFSSLKMAIDTLNNNGVGYGGVTFNIAAGYTETFTSPVAGYITTNTASIDNPVVFQKSGTGLNPKITGSVTGTSGTTLTLFGKYPRPS